MENQIKKRFLKEDDIEEEQKVFQHEIAFNLIPHIDSFREDGYTKEELKMRNETRKILNNSSINVSCTCYVFQFTELILFQ